ncbi:MAG: hypothetical protein K2P31_03090, partial [Rickettsiaceae bacterium]|nr:hypothetical protein [Rickettsiaceae bacterium]
MSKHTTEENKVEDLLKTLTNSDKITVSNIEQPFVQFTAQEGIVQYLQSLIETPLDFAGKLWRAVKGVTPTNVDKSDSDVQYQALSEDVNKGLGVITTENVDKSDSDVQYQALSEDVNKGLGVITTENVDKSGSDVQYQALSE